MDTRIYRFIYEDDNGTEYAAATVLTLRYAHNGYRMNKKIMK